MSSTLSKRDSEFVVAVLKKIVFIRLCITKMDAISSFWFFSIALSSFMVNYPSNRKIALPFPNIR